MSNETFDSEDPYGPGSDLMISLFSIAILLLGVVGVGQQFGDAQQAVDALSAVSPAPAPVVNEEPRQNPPLKLISPDELAEEARKRIEAETRAAQLSVTDAQNQKIIQDLNARMAKMQNALDEGEKKLEALRIQKPDGRLEILAHDFPIAGLAEFLDNPSALSISLNAEDVTTIRSLTSPFVPGANQIFIETAVPPELFAFMPASVDNRLAINQIYLLSAAIAQAYQQAFARNGVPLACISLIVRSFEESPDVRRQALVEASDAIEAFSELAAFYKPMSQSEAGRALATVRVLLGAADERPCEAGTLENRLSNLKPE